MKLTIISSQITGIFKQLDALGFIQMESVLFAQAPFRLRGMWRCSVIV